MDQIAKWQHGKLQNQAAPLFIWSIILTASIFSVLTAQAACADNNKNSNAVTTKTPTTTAPAPAAAAAASATRSKNFRIIDFGTTSSVGQLWAGYVNPNWGWAKETKLGPAKGKVLVPVGPDIHLETNYYGGTHISFLDSLKPDDLASLSLSNRGSGFELTDKDLVRVGRLTGLKNLTIPNSEAGKKTMEAIGHLTNLSSLDLDDTMIKGDETQPLSNLTKLSFITFNHNDMSDITLSHMQNLVQLHGIHAKRAGLTGAGLKYLANLRNLEEIYLSSNKIGDAGIRVMPVLPKLRELVLDDTGVTPACLPKLKEFPKLTNVDISYCTPSKEAFETLSQIKGLSKLHVIGKPCPPENLAPLKKVKTLKLLRLTMAPEDQAKAKKMLPGVEVTFSTNKSGVPEEIFAPAH